MPDRPTKDQIASWVNAIASSGGLSTLSYNMPVQGTIGEGGTPQRMEIINRGGIWGAFWWEVGQDMKYHLLQFQDDVSGDDNNRQFPQNWVVRLPPTAPNKCKMYRDQIFTGDPQLTVEFPGIKDSETRQLMERQWSAYLMGELQREEQDSDQSPLDTQKQHCCDYGLGVRYDILDLTRWPDRPKRKRREPMEEFEARMSEWQAKRRAISPFLVRTVHPLNVAYDLTSNPPRWAMVREPVFAWDAAERYPAWGKLSQGSLTPSAGATPLVKVEWWTPEWHAVYINGVPALGEEDGADEQGVADNPYGHIPLFPAAGGAGEADVANRPEVVLQGLIRKIRPLLLEDAVLFNLMSIYERAVSFGPKKVIQGPETDLDGERANQIEADLMAGPQVVARVPTMWKIDTLNPPPLPPEIPARRAELREDIDQATAYNVAAGAPQEGPAYKMQLQLGQVTKRTADDVLHLQQALEAWGRARLLTLKKLLADEKVGANIATGGPGLNGTKPAPEWVDLDPSKLPDHIVVTCKLTSDSDADKARKEQQGLALYNNGQGVISDVDLWRDYLQDDDPVERVASVQAMKLRETVTFPLLQQIAQGGLQQALLGMMQPQVAPTGAEPALPDQQYSVGPQGAVLPGEPAPRGLVTASPARPLQAEPALRGMPRLGG